MWLTAAKLIIWLKQVVSYFLRVKWTPGVHTISQNWRHDMIWRYLLFLFYGQVGKFFLLDILFHFFASPVVIVVLLDIKPPLAVNIWASTAITATFTLVSQTPAKSHWDVWIYWIHLIWICNCFLFGAGRSTHRFFMLYYKCCCSKVINYYKEY